MFKHGKTALLATLLIPGAAFAQFNAGDHLGTTETAIRAALAAQGYAASRFEFEDGEIEVEATQAGRLFEFEVSPESGLVLASYEEDGENDDDDDDDEEDEDGAEEASDDDDDDDDSEDGEEDDDDDGDDDDDEDGEDDDEDDD